MTQALVSSSASSLVSSLSSKTLKPRRLIALALAALCVPVAARAQTAHLSNLQTVIATASQQPLGTAVDSSGNVYFTTYGGAYKATLFNGVYTVSTITTNSLFAFGIAVDASGNVYIADNNNNRVLKETYNGSGFTESVVASATGLSQPQGIAVDSSGNLYVADYGNGRIVKETYSGGTYTQSVAVPYSYPNAYEISNVVLDSSGNLYWTTYGNYLVKGTKSGSSYTSAVIASGFNLPQGLAMDSAGNIYVGNYSGGSSGGQIYKETYSGGSYTQSLYPVTSSGAFGLALDSANNLYLTDGGRNVDRASLGAATIGSVAIGATGTQIANFVIDTAGTLGTPQLLTQGTSGLDFAQGGGSTCTGALAAGATCKVNINFTPTAPGARLGAVNLKNSSGTVLVTAFISGTGTGPQALYQSGLQSTIATNLNVGRGVSVDAAGNVYLSNTSSDNIVKYPAGSTTPITLATVSSTTSGTAVDGAGSIFFGTVGSGLYEMPAGTSPATQVGTTGLTLDNNLSVDGAGNLYSSDQNTGSIYEFSPPSYTATTRYTGNSTKRFIGMALDSNGNLFAADFNGGVLYELPTGATALTTLYSGSPLANPHSLTVDAAGDVYVANYAGTYVYRFAAGHYTATPATTSMQAQTSLAMGPDGSVYGVNGTTTLYRYTRTTNPVLSFANTSVGNSSATQTVTLENDGNAALTVPIPSQGQNPSLSSYFTQSGSSTCPLVYSTSGSAGTLASGATCTEILAFAPTVAGAVSGLLTFTDNNLNATASTQSIHLTGATATATTVIVDNESVIAGSSTVSLLFSYGAGGNANQPTGTPTVTVNGSATGVGTIACAGKTGHKACTVPYNPSSLTANTYTISVTVPSDSNYATATMTGTLTVTSSGTGIITPPAQNNIAAPQIKTVTRPAPPSSVQLAPSVVLLPASAPSVVTDIPDTGTATKEDQAADKTGNPTRP